MGGLERLESLGSSLMELSLQCLENNIRVRDCLVDSEKLKLIHFVLILWVVCLDGM